MKRIVLATLALFISGLSLAGDVAPQFQTQLQNPAGTLIDARDRTWTLNSGTDSIAATVTGTTGRSWTLLNTTDSVTSYQGGTWSTGRTWNLSSGSDSCSAVQSGTWNINNVSGTVSLPTGASTSALQIAGNSSLTSIDSKTPSLGQATMAASSPVVIASNQSAIPVSQSGTWSTGRTWTLSSGTDSVSAAISNFPATQAVTQSGTWTVQQGTPPWSVSQSGTWTTGRTWTLSSATDTVTVANPSNASASLTSVANATSSTSLLASNASRKGLIMYNDSTTDCKVAFAATASATSFTILMAKQTNYFMQAPIYTGAVSEICSNANGSMRITEL